MNLLDLYLNNNGALAQDVPGATMAQSLTPQAYDRAFGGLTAQAGKTLGKAAMGTFANSMMGMPSSMIGQSLMSGVMSPSSMIGLAAAPVNATYGLTPDTIPGKVASMGLKGLAGVLGGPVGAMAAGLMGDFAIDGLMDYADMRKDEPLRDDLEESKGWGPGHSTYADMRDISNSAQAKQASFAKAVQDIGRVAAKYGIQAPSFTPADLTLSALGVGADGFGGTTYGGTFGSIGGPFGGARAVDAAYGPSMGGWAGLGIGNPSSYGGSNGRDRDTGGFGANDGNSDTAGNAGYGR